MSGHEAARALVAAPIYGGYLYSYPHKTAYRRLEPPVPLREAWARERKEALFLYLHVPFCEMRCGFCNLFTLTRADALVEPYLAALDRQAAAIADALGDAAIARLAIGGGTPTFLAPRQLERLLDIAARRFAATPRTAPTSVETSPATATPERLAVLAGHGVSRVSIGVESFRDDEAKAMGRPQSRRVVEAALAAIRDAGFATLNIDLIYGAAGQTAARFLESVDAALAWRPEELYLYPLYVRPLTGLGRRATPEDGGDWDARRLAVYRAARDRLLEAGYAQVSMRMFRRGRAGECGPPYSCTRDGMVGLGAGARSYTSRLHYSSDYAVGQAGIKAIVEDFCAREAVAFAYADHGIRLDDEDRRRRFVLLSLLQADGLSLADYVAVFGADVFADLPQLLDLEEAELAIRRQGRLELTAAGLERSDAIGPWLQAAGVRARMQSFAPR